MWGKSSKSTRGSIFFKLEYHEMLFPWKMDNLAKQRLQIFGGDQNCLHLRWTIFLFHFYENLQINFWRHPRMKQKSKRHNMKKWLLKPVCYHKIQNEHFFKSKTFALRPVGKQDLYPFIQINIRWFFNKCSRWDSVWWDGSRRGEAGTIFQHWRISFPGFYSCIEISELENILSQKK